PRAHAEPLQDAMRGSADDEEVKAGVRRIDSPGGSATASDQMWHAVRRVASRKPVIVSVGDMAASGGYWVASAGTEIVAHDSSLLGSIGVVGGKIVAEDLSERAGVNVTRLTRGKRAAWMSSMRGFSDDERAAFERSLQHTYRLFIRRIAQGREMTPEQIAPLAEGRIVSGRRAREGGLVDAAGGLQEALARAREQAELPDDVAVEVWPDQPTLMQQLSQLTGSSARRVTLLSTVLELGRLSSTAGLLDALILGDESHIAALPFVFRLR
ncbi:MAG: S49 family peptidase, partial [Myxococcales bacterium]|nr:S49 family peptidase [Myxococcales bacterium]